MNKRMPTILFFILLISIFIILGLVVYAFYSLNSLERKVNNNEKSNSKEISNISVRDLNSSGRQIASFTNHQGNTTSLRESLTSLTYMMNSETINFKDESNAITAIVPRNRCIFPIWAEENGGLNSNSNEWSFGNGDSGSSLVGIPIPFPCYLRALSLSVRRNSGGVEVGVYKGDSNTSPLLTITLPPNVLNNYVCLDSSSSIDIMEGEYIRFRTINNSGNANDGKICAWFIIKDLTDNRLDMCSNIV